MLKHLTGICLLLFIMAKVEAQQTVDSGYANNPFGSLKFPNGPTDTLTIFASYAGEFGKLSDDNVSTIEGIDKVHGLNIKKFRYAIAFNLDGYSQKFYIPCRDNSLFNQLSEKQNTINRLKLKCVVYRFYTLDGLINFFYIDKAVLVAKL